MLFWSALKWQSGDGIMCFLECFDMTIRRWNYVLFGVLLYDSQLMELCAFWSVSWWNCGIRVLWHDTLFLEFCVCFGVLWHNSQLMELWYFSSIDMTNQLFFEMFNLVFSWELFAMTISWCNCELFSNPLTYGNQLIGLFFLQNFDMKISWLKCLSADDIEIHWRPVHWTGEKIWKTALFIKTEDQYSKVLL